MLNIDEILYSAIQKDASDIHIFVGKPPTFRISGHLEEQGTQIITEEMAMELTKATMKDTLFELYKKDLEVDYSYKITIDSEEFRFRVNAFTQQGYSGMAFRAIPKDILTISQLGLPETIRNFTDLPRGLVLVTGPTGSGKSTTLAAMIKEINMTRAENIITIEDPIEYVHFPEKSIIQQRELGQDTLSFGKALKSALRQDPDVILVGEMRDLETISLAISLAETGHLIFSTLHTTSASQTVDRIIDVFPPDQQEQVRLQLSNVLMGIISQTLVQKNGGGRVCATEILVATSAARANIRNAKTAALDNVIQTGIKQGMHSLEKSLAELVKKNIISQESAFSKSSKHDILKQLLGETEKK